MQVMPPMPRCHETRRGSWVKRAVGYEGSRRGVVGLCEIWGLIQMEVVARKRTLSNAQPTWAARCGVDEDEERRGWSAGERRGIGGVVGEKKVQGSKSKVAGVIKKRPKVSSLCHLLQLNRQIQARCQLKKGERAPPGTAQYTVDRVKLGKLAGIWQGSDRGSKWLPWV